MGIGIDFNRDRLSAPHVFELRFFKIGFDEEVVAWYEKRQYRAWLHELPNLGLHERREIFERIGELEDQELLKGGEPTAADKALLDRELDEYRRDPDAGSTWPEVESRLRKAGRP